MKSVYSIGISYEEQLDTIKISVLDNFTSISNAWFTSLRKNYCEIFSYINLLYIKYKVPINIDNRHSLLLCMLKHSNMVNLVRKKPSLLPFLYNYGITITKSMIDQFDQINNIMKYDPMFLESTMIALDNTPEKYYLFLKLKDLQEEIKIVETELYGAPLPTKLTIEQVQNFVDHYDKSIYKQLDKDFNDIINKQMKPFNVEN